MLTWLKIFNIISSGISSNCRFLSWPNFQIIMIIQSDKLIIIDKINFNLLGDRDSSEPSVTTSEMFEILADLKELPIIVRIYRTKQAAISMSTRQNFQNSDLTRNFSRE